MHSNPQTNKLHRSLRVFQLFQCIPIHRPINCTEALGYSNYSNSGRPPGCLATSPPRHLAGQQASHISRSLREFQLFQCIPIHRPIHCPEALGYSNYFNSGAPSGDYLASWRAGELASWRAGELASWRAGELASRAGSQVASLNIIGIP